MEVIEKTVFLPGREELSLRLEVSDGEIHSAKLEAIGGIHLLNLINDYRQSLRGSVAQLPLPKGSSTEAILLRELILKAQNKWSFPFCEAELCHCRGVATLLVDQAIITGAHTPEKVSQLTSASTACGTCRPDVEAIIHYRTQEE